ncbi:DUF58 domain-containing protein [Gimesia benthica]|uniref:DUF58 domain-containing protein n=1 Tax=Gimesia benthica TaxID=2608982 RepID=A0A6I6AJL7_9PLAN|nr:DUF58 domain-containing protein [Gimesia benthica]QGQ26657.1 DUF58 domain-containing protein [Gimesia benthica]
MHEPDKRNGHKQSETAHSWLDTVNTMLQYDFCPQLNQWVYWVRNPFWCLAISILTAFICGLLVNSAILYIAAALAMIILIGVLWPWISVQGLSAELSFNKVRTRCGEPVGARLVVKNSWPWPAWGVYLRHPFSEHDDHLCEVAIDCIPGWKTSEYIWDFSPRKRGIYSTSTAFLETAFPFGLYKKKIPLTVDSVLIVWPEISQLAFMPELREVTSSEDRFASHRAGDYGDVIGTRAFRLGDSLRRVHWSQSARQGQMIVTERQAAAVCALRVIPDLQRAHYRHGNNDSLEAVIRITASICHSLLNQHASVECLVGDQLFRCDGNQRDLHKLLDELASIPNGGLENSLRKHAASPLPEFIVTNSSGFAQRVNQGANRLRSRMIVVQDAPARQSGNEPSCECEPWLHLNGPEESRLKAFTDSWKKACYAG